MVDTLERPTIDFREAAASQAKATLVIDHDVAEYLKSQFSNWQGHANDLLRFFMETQQAKDAQFENVFAQPEPGEMDEPAAVVSAALRLDA
jgi:hypothetical protein